MQDYRSDYKNYCLTCKEYDIYSKGDSTHRGFRCKHHHRPMAFDESCSSYDFDKARGNNIIHDAVEWRVRKGYDPKPDSSYWYVVSSICKILSNEYGEDQKEQTNRYLNAFKTFREFLLSYPNGINFLADYDINGLRLANQLLDEYAFCKKQALYFIETELLPLLDTFANMIDYNNHQAAFKSYTRIMQCLSDEYRYDPIKAESKDLELIGQGRTRKLLQSVE